MKASIKIVSFFILSVSMFGCKKLLKENNPSSLNAEAYETPAGYETLVNAAYSYNKAWYGKEEGMGISEMGTDLWTAGSETMVATSGLAAENRSLILYQNLSSINQNVTRLWKQLYTAVNLCNTGIKLIETQGIDPTDPRYARAAELRFLRAFYNWHIVETWGGVHLTTEPTIGAKATPTANKSSIEDFYKLIISDLEFAKATLPKTSAENGRANSNVAKAFLARVYLTKAYKDPSYFPLAKSMADSVIATGGYSLGNSYADLWDMGKQRTTKEVIWSVNYSTDINNSDVYDEKTNPYGYGVDILSASGNPTNTRGNNGAHTLFITLYDRIYASFDGVKIINRDLRNGAPFARFKPTRYLLDLYDETKDSRYKGSFQTVWKVNYAVPKGRLKGKTLLLDTALVITKNPVASTKYYTFNVYNSYAENGGSIALTSNQLFPSLRKFQDSTRTATDNGSGNAQSAKDVFVIRLAEMYLISAEASVQMGDLGSAKEKLDLLRNKRAIAGQDLSVNAADLNLDFILDERAREFAGEHIRWFDLKRTGQLISRVKAKNPDVGQYINENHIVRPIPQTQLDVVTNKSEFTQNSGY